MFDLILFSTIGLLLLVLIGFLVIVVRDHMKSKSFELYVHQNQEAYQEEFDRSIRARTATREPAPAPQPEKVREEAPERPDTSEVPRAEPETPAAKRSTRPVREVDSEAERKFQEKLRQTIAETAGGDAPGLGGFTPPAFEPTPEPEPENESPTVMPLHPETPAKPELTEAQKQAREILQKDYGHFSHERLVEGMGLSPEEADEFVVELIHQLESAIPDLDEAVEGHRYEDVEHITHGLKGAALNIGEGGVAQLLVDYNTYMKHGTEQPIIEAYQTLLKRTVSDLKVEYSQVA